MAKTSYFPGALLTMVLVTVALGGCSNGSGNSGNNGNLGRIDPPGSGGTPMQAPALSFVAPGNSLDLANYTLSARYDLPTGSGNNLLASEASAVTYNHDTGTLFIVGDHGTSVVQMSRDGQFIDSMTLPADPDQPQGTYLYDPEGIAYVGNGQFVLIEERLRRADLFTYVPNTALSPAELRQVKLGTTIGNIGLEGVSFDPQSGGFIFVKEKTPMGIFQTSIDFVSGTASNGSATTENSTNLFDPALLNVADFGDVFALSNTLPDTAPDRGDLLVLSQESGVLLKVDRSGAIRSRLDIGIPAQHEGLAADENNTIYFANELGGGAGRPQLWVYTPTVGSDAVGAGSNLYLTFTEPVAGGSGNIVVSDGASDTRTIAISDSEQVRISGSTVTIDPQADLLPGRAYSVQAAAGVIRPASGNNVSSAINVSFNTRAENVPPTLVSSLPADNALGVSGSHILLTFDEPVQAGSGSILLTGTGGDVRTLAVGDITQVTINGNTVDINPSADLLPGTAYNVQMQSGVIVDLAGNAFAGLIGPDTLNFTTAASGGGTQPTALGAGDILFLGINADPPDAIAFVLLKDVAAGTQILFTDKDYTAGSSLWPTNEAAFSWTADVAYAAGAIVTIQTEALSSDKGVAVGVGGGISTSGETYYAFQGVITAADAGAISVERFIAAINIGDAAGDIPSELGTAGAYIHFTEDNARYAGSLDRSDLNAFASRARDPANWERNDSAGYALIGGGLFGEAPPPPVGGTELMAGDVLFIGMNADAPDAIAFTILKDVVAGTHIEFTDKDYTSGSDIWPTNEAAFTWTADQDYPAGIIVTIQPDADPMVANMGSVVGAGGGISTSAETYYAFQGSIVDAQAGAITVDRFLATITLGDAAGDIPADVSAAGAHVGFAQDNVLYSGSLDRSDIAAFAARIKDTANWSTNDAAAFPVEGGSLFGGTSLAAGDVLFMAANADAPDAIAFVLMKDVVAGTQIGFTDKDYTEGAPSASNEAAFTWVADSAYAAGTIVSVDVDALLVDKGTVYGSGGGISPNAETYYAFQGTIFNPDIVGAVRIDRFLAAINIRGTAGDIPPELVAAGSYIRFDADNMRYAGSLDRSDLAAFGPLVKDPANWEVNDAAAYPLTGGSFFP
jgi:uncharacterized protein YjiK